MEGTTESQGSYEDLCRNFEIHVPKYYNFGFDVLDSWAEKDRNKLAMIWVSAAWPCMPLAAKVLVSVGRYCAMALSSNWPSLAP